MSAADKPKWLTKAETTANRRGYAGIGLHMPKTSANVGSVLRAVGVYKAAFLAVSGTRYKRAATDTRAEHRHTPLLHVDNLRSIVPFDCVPVAVELIDSATPLPIYHHPERAFYIFGPEDGTLGKNILSWCRDVVYVPTSGCMNLAATVNVVLYDRLCKKLRLIEDASLDLQARCELFRTTLKKPAGWEHDDHRMD